MKFIVPYLRRLAVICFLFAFNACTYDIIEQEKACIDVPVLNLISSTDTECGSESGEIVVEAEGVEGSPLKFSINGENENVTGRFENLAAATYEIAVETIDGCSSTISVEIKNLSGLNISVQTDAADCGSNSGVITIAATGGQEPYRFKLGTDDFQSDNTFENLATGDYTLIAEDASGCSVSQNVEIATEVDFSAIQTIIQTNCVSSSCHGGNVNPDFRDAGNISGNSSRIKSRTSAKTMPPSSSGKSLSNQEIALIACWVDSGANQ